MGMRHIVIDTKRCRVPGTILKIDQWRAFGQHRQCALRRFAIAFVPHEMVLGAEGIAIANDPSAGYDVHELRLVARPEIDRTEAGITAEAGVITALVEKGTQLVAPPDSNTPYRYRPQPGRNHRSVCVSFEFRLQEKQWHRPEWQASHRVPYRDWTCLINNIRSSSRSKGLDKAKSTFDGLLPSPAIRRPHPVNKITVIDGNSSLAIWATWFPST